MGGLQNVLVLLEPIRPSNREDSKSWSKESMVHQCWSKSSSNCIVQELNFSLREIDGYGVVLGTSSSVRGTEISRGVVLSLGRLLLSKIFFLLECFA